MFDFFIIKQNITILKSWQAEQGYRGYVFNFNVIKLFQFYTKINEKYPVVSKLLTHLNSIMVIIFIFFHFYVICNVKFIMKICLCCSFYYLFSIIIVMFGYQQFYDLIRLKAHKNIFSTFNIDTIFDLEKNLRYNFNWSKFIPFLQREKNTSDFYWDGVYTPSSR